VIGEVYCDDVVVVLGSVVVVPVGTVVVVVGVVVVVVVVGPWPYAYARMTFML
jgi:hypothetical protein